MWIISASVWLFKRKSITMHGNMIVKFVDGCLPVLRCSAPQLYEPQISLYSPSCVGELSPWHIVELLSFAGIRDGPLGIDSFYKYFETCVGRRSIPSGPI